MCSVFPVMIYCSVTGEKIRACRTEAIEGEYLKETKSLSFTPTAGKMVCVTRLIKHYGKLLHNDVPYR